MSTDTLEKIKELTESLNEAEKMEAQRRQRAMFLLLNGITDMVFVADSKGIIKFANPSSYRVLGYDPHDLVGQPIDTIMSEEDAAYQLETINKMDTEAEVIGYGKDIVCKTKDGCNTKAHLYLGELKDNNVHLFIGVLHKVL